DAASVGMRRGKPHRDHRGDEDYRVKRDPGFAPATAVGNRSQEWRKKRNTETAIGLDLAGNRLSAHAIADDVIREIWRKEINPDDEDVGITRPFEHRPGNLPEPAGGIAATRRRFLVGRLKPRRQSTCFGGGAGRGASAQFSERGIDCILAV